AERDPVEAGLFGGELEVGRAQGSYLAAGRVRRVRGAGLLVGDGRAHALGQQVQGLRLDRLHEVLVAGEVVVSRPRRHPGPAGHLAQDQRLRATLAGQRDGRGDQRVAEVAVVVTARGPGGRGHVYILTLFTLDDILAVFRYRERSGKGTIMSGETVLVTGGTGYLARWCIRLLLERGYDVHTTVRDQSAEAGLRSLMSADADPGRLRAFPVDLLRDDGWKQAADSC